MSSLIVNRGMYKILSLIWHIVGLRSISFHITSLTVVLCFYKLQYEILCFNWEMNWSNVCKTNNVMINVKNGIIFFYPKLNHSSSFSPSPIKFLIKLLFMAFSTNSSLVISPSLFSSIASKISWTHDNKTSLSA